MKQNKNKKSWTVSKLPNGLRYMFIPRPEMMSATAMVLVGTGSEYESKKQNGLAHFLEHMCFKGTEKRPNSLVIVKEFEILGAQYNAFTSGEYTGYYGKGQSSDTGLLLDICADIFLNSIFPEEEIQKEKRVVIEEINMYEDDPQYKVGQLIDQLMYDDQPAGRDTTGTKETVSSFTRQDILDYHKNNYTPANTLVVVAGNFDKTKIEKQIKKTFGKMQKKNPPKKIETVVKQNSPAIKILNKKSEQTHIILSFHAYNRFSPKRKASKMLANILGNGMASRLFHLLREKLGVCYYVHASSSSGAEQGHFSIRAGLANDKVVQTLTAIVKELKRIKNEPVPADEIGRVKKSITASSRISLETSDSYADHFGFQELFGMKIEEVKDSVAKYQKISSADVQKIAKEIFVPRKVNLAIVGPHKNEVELLKILKKL